MKLVIKSWGSEMWLLNNELYCSKVMICFKDKWSSKGKYHYHKNKDETFFILEGELHLVVDGYSIILEKGDSFRIPPFTLHKFTSVTPYCKFIEASTHHDDEDSYKI